jgi:hypothetical protein
MRQHLVAEKTADRFFAGKRQLDRAGFFVDLADFGAACQAFGLALGDLLGRPCPGLTGRDAVMRWRHAASGPCLRGLVSVSAVGIV